MPFKKWLEEALCRLEEWLGGDYTPLEHVGYAVLMQLGALALFGWLNYHAALAAGTASGIAFFLGREHAQAEKRWRKEWGVRDDLSGFDLRYWDWGSILDLLCPVVACFAVAVLALVIYQKI